MKTMLALLPILMLALGAQQAPPRGERDVAVTLVNGSHFAARIPKGDLVLATRFGEQRIPMRDIRSVRRRGEEFQVVTRRMSIEGRLEQQALVLQTAVGTLRVPIGDVVRIDFGSWTSLDADGRTVALWSFDEAGGGAEVVKQRPVKFHDMGIKEVDGLTALVRNGPAGYAETPSDEALKFASGDFTIEARVKVGAMTKGYAAILSKNDSANAQLRNYCLLVSSAGALYCDSLGRLGSHTHSSPGSLVPRDRWTYIAVAVVPSKGHMTYYVDGKQVHTYRRAFGISANDGPVYIGASPTAQSWSQTPEAIQFVRLSAGERTAEEIAEWHKALGEGAHPLVRRSGRGLSLARGGFIAAKRLGLQGVVFRTKYGAIALSEKSRGRIRIYPHREKELPAIRRKVEELIQMLGAPDIDRRESAEKEILGIGTPAVGVLEGRRNEKDEEVRSRVERILKKFKETGVDRLPVGDVLHMGVTVLHGWLERDAVEIDTGYGTFQVPAKNLRMVELGPVEGKGGRLLRLRSGEVLEGTAPAKSRIRIQTEFGALEIPFEEVSEFRRRGEKEGWEVRTKTMRIQGTIENPHFRLETPAGGVSVPFGEILEFTSPKEQASSGGMNRPSWIVPKIELNDPFRLKIDPKIFRLREKLKLKLKLGKIE